MPPKPPARLSPTMAKLQQAVALHQSGKLAEASALYREVLRVEPQNFDALHLSGVAQRAQGNAAVAVDLIGRALARVKGRSAAANYNLGNALGDLGRHAETLAAVDRALALEPNYAEAHHLRAVALRHLGRSDAAIASCAKAIGLAPKAAYAHNEMGVILAGLERHEEALGHYERALACDPRHLHATHNRGVALRMLGRADEALAAYAQALALKPDFAEAVASLAILQQLLKRPVEAAASYERLLALAPDYDFALGSMLSERLLACDWRDYDTLCARIADATRAGKRADKPFTLMAFSDDPALHLQSARIFAASRYTRAATAASPLPAHAAAPAKRLKIAYISADFRDHAVAYLIANLFEAHDRSRFEIHGISVGPDSDGAMRKRLVAAFDDFADMRAKNDIEIAGFMRERNYDIVVDLMGYTADARTGVLARRVAPVQVNYLGYPGTMGADFIDYILVDSTVAPAGSDAHFAEKIVRLPHCYQANDAKRIVAPQAPTRAQAGLPEGAFVFCCFNNAWKISPGIFALWMRLLRRIEGSVLWLLATNDAAVANLRAAAAGHGIDPARLVFAPHAKHAEHLARHVLADLFVDTFPYNAHTTASDALWMGVPLLTYAGRSFPARVAASLLRSVGMPEMVMPSLDAYEAEAVSLAASPARLAGLRAKLAQNRSTAPLFDIDLFRRGIESAFETMQARAAAGQTPAAFDVVLP
ncbi:MAG: tetratricopeptide repeat protein [Telmatospirillum sp.]|nr:tetratricopeptide repeat protein [Telmatospirillum sp.]